MHSLGLKADGLSLLGDGVNTANAISLSPNTDFIAIAAGGQHSLG